MTVFPTSGVKLQGNISGFDNFCVVLRRSPWGNWSINTRSRPSSHQPISASIKAEDEGDVPAAEAPARKV